MIDRHSQFRIASRFALVWRGVLAGTIALVAGAPASLAAPTPSETVLYDFPGGAEGANPLGAVLVTPGAIYGTASTGGQNNFGAVFKLTPPGPCKGGWSNEVLYSFKGGSDGGQPYAGLIADSTGALYGTTTGHGTGYGGTVFKLTPPAKGRANWTYSVLTQFNGGANDGETPYGGLIIDENDTLYGTTYSGGVGSCPGGCGTVFSLTPPAAGQTAWTKTLLYLFAGGSDGANPYAGLTTDSTGALYGTTSIGGGANSGTVFKLTPPSGGGTAWPEQLLYSFKGAGDGGQPYDSVIAGPNGGLYGTTTGYTTGQDGTVFRINPPAGGGTAWSESLLYKFVLGSSPGETPYGGVIMSKFGALFGATYRGGIGGCYFGCGTIYKVSPPAAGQTAWTQTALYIFTGGSDGATPNPSLTADATGNLYGTTSAGGESNNGVVFMISGTGFIMP
jgi:uncharacterized repeat protein (TIGR03803 family)